MTTAFASKGTMRAFKPNRAERKMGIIVKRACRCTICGSPADRYVGGYQCHKDRNHIGDPYIGMFGDMTFPGGEKIDKEIARKRKQRRQGIVAEY